MTFDPANEASKLIKYFIAENLRPEEACAAMSYALIGIIQNKAHAREFIRVQSEMFDKYCMEIPYD